MSITSALSFYRQLSVLDFSSTVMATSNAWLIEFYSSWCGHCIDFAPTFLKLANDVKGSLLSLYFITVNAKLIEYLVFLQDGRR